jgi:hypothetical protein
MICVVCGKRAETHHIKTRGSGGSEEHWNKLNLCRLHHTMIHQIGNVRFLKEFSHIVQILTDKGWYIENLFGVEKLKHDQERT